MLYFFPQQKNAEELFQHCKSVIKAPLGGFGQAVLAETFSHYVHRWFIGENPSRHTFDRAVIQDFFVNHERYHFNLVKYSCYSTALKELEPLIKDHLQLFLRLNCLLTIKEGIEAADNKSIIVTCSDPFVALPLVQELFSAGERQVLTPFSQDLTTYKPTGEVKYIILVGESPELSELQENRKTKNYLYKS